MPIDDPELTRCSLLVRHLVNLEALPREETRGQMTVAIIADLADGFDVWKAEEAVVRLVTPLGATLQTVVRLPAAHRLVFEATLANGKSAPGIVARLLADITDALVQAASQ